MDSCYYCGGYHHEFHVCDEYINALGSDCDSKGIVALLEENKRDQDLLRKLPEGPSTAVGEAPKGRTQRGEGLG